MAWSIAVTMFASSLPSTRKPPLISQLAPSPARHTFALVPHPAAAEQQNEAGKPRFGPERRIQLAKMHRLRRLLDQHGAGQRRAGRETHGDDVVAPVPPFPGIGLDQAGAAPSPSDTRPRVWNEPRWRRKRDG